VNHATNSQNKKVAITMTEQIKIVLRSIIIGGLTLLFCFQIILGESKFKISTYQSLLKNPFDKFKLLPEITH
jgi:hypothetical protein